MGSTDSELPAPAPAAGPEAAAAKAKRRDTQRWPEARVVPLVLALVVAVLVIAASEWSYLNARASLDSLGERAQARQNIHLVLRRLLDAETGQRGYLLTSRREYLLPLDEVRADLDRALDALKRHYAGDAALAAKVERLSMRVVEKLSEVDETLALFNAADDTERWRDLVLTDIGREKMEAVRAAAEGLLASEGAFVDRERADVFRTLALGRLAVSLSAVAALLGLATFMWQSRQLDAVRRAHARELEAERDVLEQQVRQRTLELVELNERLQDVREAERGRLARLLHDELGSLLTAAKLDLTRLRRALSATPMPEPLSERLKHLTDTIDAGIQLKRSVIEELSPSALPNLGLRAAIEIMASEFTRSSGVEIELRLDDDVQLPDVARIVAYRVVQVALANVAQHADVRRAEVQVRAVADGVRIAVRDHGRGFDAAAMPRHRHSLLGLRYRVEALGGRLTVTTAPGQGTEVEARIPAPAG